MSREKLHAACLWGGVGDVLCCLWAVQAAKDAGYDVAFYSQMPALAKLWHEDSHDLLHAPDEARVLLGRWNEYSKAMGEPGEPTRLELFAGRLLPGLAPVRPRLRVELPDVPAGWGNIILCTPGAQWTQREWPIGHWMRLQDLAEKEGWRLVAAGDKKELLARFRHSWTPRNAGEWATGLLRARLLITGDTGPVHLAGVLNTPAVCVHAILRPECLTAHYGSVRSVFPGGKSGCAGCAFRADRGFTGTCRTYCGELAGLAPGEVWEAAEGQIAKFARDSANSE